MKNKCTPSGLWLIVAFAFAVIGTSRSYGQVTTAFTYQGQLRQSGTNANGTYTLIFKLYDSATGSNQIGATITNLPTVANGLFAVNLDFGASPFDGSGRWLEITVHGDATNHILAPRVAITPVPYALYALNGSTASGGNVVTSNLTVQGGSTSYFVTVDPDGSLAIRASGPGAKSAEADGIVDTIISVLREGIIFYKAFTATDGTFSGAVKSVLMDVTGLAKADGGFATGPWKIDSGTVHLPASDITLSDALRFQSSGVTRLVISKDDGEMDLFGNLTVVDHSFLLAGPASRIEFPDGSIQTNAAPNLGDWKITTGTYGSFSDVLTFSNQNGIAVAIAPGPNALMNKPDESVLKVYGGLNLDDFIHMGGNLSFTGTDPNPGQISFAGGASIADDGDNDLRIDLGEFAPGTMTVNGDLQMNGDLHAISLDVEDNVGVIGDLTVGGCITGNLCQPSDRNLKSDFEPINGEQVLERLSQLPISIWNYKTDAKTRHIGPMAQDFYAAFNVGPDDKHIATVDEEGVALAAIQGLNKKLEERSKKLEAENAELREDNRELKARLEKIEKLMERNAGGR